MFATSHSAALVRRTAGVLFGLLLGAGLGFAEAPAGKVYVADVLHEGLVHVPAAKVMNLIKTRPGTEYRPDVVQIDLRKLSATRLFASVKTETQQTGDGNVVVRFRFAEYP